jgi:AcrR family transcriptional regulator
MATERREDALSRQRIVDTAVEMLDASGESGLTFRALSARLKTGPGAIYWHVANKTELLVAATGAVLAAALAAETAETAPAEAIRAIALGVYDAFEAHPWIGPELTRAPAPATILQIFERLGRQVQALGVPEADLFSVASALLYYIFGVGNQNAAMARAVEPSTNRAEFFERIVAQWAALDPTEFPFLQAITGQMRDHDDRVQFLDGVDLILAGIASRPTA